MKKVDEPFKRETISSGQVKRRTILAFSILVVADFLGFKAFKWVANQPDAAGTPKPLRAALNTNENIFSKVFDPDRLVPEYPVSAAVQKVRFNGDDGLSDEVDEETWRLQVIRAAGETVSITLPDIKRLPKKDIVFDFKCIEGWSQVTHWAGVPLKTFMQYYKLENEAKMKYIGLETPDKGYYVGIDMPSALQPQTILCYEVNGKPLSQKHGFPLRLIIPVKYGIKHLKCIGTMFFSNDKPPDYWAERGYDYYAGH